MYIIQIEITNSSRRTNVGGRWCQWHSFKLRRQALKEFVGNLATLRIDSTWRSNGAAAISRSLEWLFQSASIQKGSILKYMHRCYWEKKLLIDEHDQARCWVPVPQRSSSEFYQWKSSFYMLPSTPSNMISKLWIMQKHFFRCARLCPLGPNPTDINGRPLNHTKGWHGLPMSISSLTIYSTYQITPE